MYNMFAVCGLGKELPVLIYVYERTLKEVEELLYNFGRLTPIIDAQNEEYMNDEDPQNKIISNNETVSKK